MSDKDKSHRAAASQYFVAGELCRRGLVAVLTLGNCPNTDILVSDKDGTKFAHVQVKTYRPRQDKTVSVGLKSEKDYGPQFFWVLAGIPEMGSKATPEYYIIPSCDLATIVRQAHQKWLATPGTRGQAHNDSKVRAVAVPPSTNKYSERTIDEYLNRWDLIVDACSRECE